MQKTISSKHGVAVSDYLTLIRERAELNQRELADLLGREHSFVANYERGQRRVDLAEFFWICKACNTSPQEEAVNLMKILDEL